MTSTVAIHALKLVAVGNSRGVRLPRELLGRYGISSAVVLEERPDGLLLRSADGAKLSLEQTFDQMALASEDWAAWDATVGDGLVSQKW